MKGDTGPHWLQLDYLNFAAFSKMLDPMDIIVVPPKAGK